MINRLWELFSLNKSNPVTKKQRDFIGREIEMMNYGRMFLLLAALIIIEVLFICFVDIPNLMHFGHAQIWTDQRYFTVHITLFSICVLGMILIKYLLKSETCRLTIIRKTITPVLTAMILILLGIINGLDQLKIGQSSSVYVASVLICGAAVILRFRVSVCVYLTSFLSFAAGLFAFQKNEALLYSNLTNGFIFVVAVLVISATVYNSHFVQLYDKIILKQTNDRLHYVSTHDELTSLLNRRSFENEIKQRLADETALSEPGLPFIVMVDIDYFKKVNDTYGHTTGDIVLKEVADILMRNTSGTDLAARWGGEEFLLLLFRKSAGEARSTAEMLRQAVEKRIIKTDAATINITVSIGLAQMTGDDSASFDASFQSADRALYAAKRGGRNQVVSSQEKDNI